MELMKGQRKMDSVLVLLSFKHHSYKTLIPPTLRAQAVGFVFQGSNEDVMKAN